MNSGSTTPRRMSNASEIRQVPLECEREPIHIINRIQPCGYLINISRDLKILQCSANAVELLPPGQIELLLSEWKTLRKERVAASSPNADEDDLEDISALFKPSHGQNKADAPKRKAALEFVIGKHLDIFFSEEHVKQVKDVIETVFFSGTGGDSTPNFARANSSKRHSLPHPIVPPMTTAIDDQEKVNFFRRSQSTLSFSGRLSCSVLASADTFLLELEKIPPLEMYAQIEDRDTMSFMEEIAKELRKCWSIEEMASLVCARVMNETPYDRGMVYKFDHEDCGEVVYETFRSDASVECRRESFLGLRFPASDIPRQARELFMKNTLRVVYDVEGNDWELYPPMVDMKLPSGEHGLGYTDLSMCRLRGSSYVHLKYLANMGVTSTMVIAIIVNKKLWGLYAFHGYRTPLVPSARTRFLCEMASITTSIIMESLTRKEENDRLMRLEISLNKLLPNTSLGQFFETHLADIAGAMDVDLIACRVKDPPTTPNIQTFIVKDRYTRYGIDAGENEITEDVFDSLYETYGQVCRDYGIVYIDAQKTNALLVSRGIHTLAFFCNSGIDVMLGRSQTIESVTWGGDPDKKLEPDGTLTPRNSFAAYVKDHIRKGRPWNQCDRRLVSRFADQIENHRTKELNVEHTKTILTLAQEKQDAVDIARVNFEFFAHMAHELRTPFHGMVGSLQALRDDPALANNELLRTAELCGKSMVKILDDILLVAKGSYNLQIEEHPFDLQTFVRETKNDMQSFAMLEGQSIEMRRENIFCRNVSGDFHRLRQVIHNLVSNAIKFSEDKIYLEVNQVKTFPEVLAVWRTCINVYPNSVPSLVEVSTFMADLSTSEGVKKDVVWAMFSVTDKGIGISGADMKKLGIAFTQLSSGRQKKYQGTGLGLNICNMLVSAMGGKLVMFSAVGKGSCFSFAVPIKINSSAPVADDVTTLVKEDAREDLQREFDSRGLRDKGVKVMVVDDSAINRKLCSRKVRRWMPSVTITECQSGVVALEEYQRSPSNVMGIFMDYHMHDMDGDECTRRIREFETMSEAISHHVYIAGYTADVLEDSTGKLLSAGMNSVIPKPEPPRAVEDELKKMMDEFTSRENDDTP